MYELSTTSADGVSIGEPRSERVQTDLDERVTGEWNEQEVAVQSVAPSNGANDLPGDTDRNTPTIPGERQIWQSLKSQSQQAKTINKESAASSVVLKVFSMKRVRTAPIVYS